MSTLRWIVLAAALIVCWIGLKPHFSAPPLAQQDISALTAAPVVARYLQQHQQLPAFYLTKSQARRQGWDPAKGNLCVSLPGHAIGGDRFANREGRLPAAAGERFFEADVNYQCGHRNADRLIWSTRGTVWLTRDHYRTFTRMP